MVVYMYPAQSKPNVQSMVGITRTAPSSKQDVSKLRFAVFSCANYVNVGPILSQAWLY